MTEDRRVENSEKDVRRRNKIIQIALILPIIGVLLFMTPIIDVFTGSDGASTAGGEGDSSRVSRLVIYIFGVWGLLIVCAYALAHFIRFSFGDE
ncbi:MAG: hypothetical protein DHS20C08_22190 [Rhodomicrobium sp.]|nr:MAG: hypothetical protein DHS20C08_22190 [Rhodomicrobium sp.]